jgi:hypothetical protein
MRATELADACRARGLTVVEVAGWHTRGYAFATRPRGALRHWDAIASTAPTAGLAAITNGRTTPTPLDGPLANLYQSRHVDERGLDVVYVVAAGKANHAGAGIWRGITGNYALLGLEIAWSGPGEDLPPARKLTSELAMRALLDVTTGGPDDVAEHREYATPPGRKIDTNLDGNELRRRMVELEAAGPNPGDDEMLTPDESKALNSVNAAMGIVLDVLDRLDKWRFEEQADGDEPVDVAALAPELATALAPLLEAQIIRLGDEDLTRIAQRVQDEQDRRERERLGG